MAISCVSILASTASGAALEIRTPATTRAKVIELCAQDVGAVQSTRGVGRPSAIGVAPVSSPLIMQNPADGISQLTYATVWNTSNPTSPPVFHRRQIVGTQAGYNIIWTFPVGLVIPVSGTIVVWNFTSAAATTWNVVVDE